MMGSGIAADVSVVVGENETVEHDVLKGIVTIAAIGGGYLGVECDAVNVMRSANVTDPDSFEDILRTAEGQVGSDVEEDARGEIDVQTGGEGIGGSTGDWKLPGEPAPDALVVVGVDVVDGDPLMEKFRVVQEDSNTCVPDFEMFDAPVAGVGEQYANVVGLLTAKDSGICAGSVGTQSDWLPWGAGAGERQLLVPGGATSQEDLISGGEDAALIHWRKGTPGLHRCVRTGIIAV